MTPDATAAKEIAGYYNDHHPDNIATIAAAIREAYAEREAAVAELVRLAELRSVELAKHCSGDNSCCYGCQELKSLQAALAALEGK